MALSSRRRVGVLLGSMVVWGAIAAGACSAAPGRNGFPTGTGAAEGEGGSAAASMNSANGGSTGAITLGVGGNGAGGGMLVGDPTTCAEAAANKTYIGCDFWPTVTANIVWSVFDFTAVVANAGTVAAMVTVTGPNNTNQTVMVAPNSLGKVYLPWVPALKGGDGDECGNSVPLPATVTQAGAAYHLVSSVPVTVYQFSALEYAGQGGEAGKSWASCPGSQLCTDPSSEAYGISLGCFSFTNDASLLLPSTAMTGNYRITTSADWAMAPEGATLTITGTQANTMVTVYVAPGGHVVGGGGIPETQGGGSFSFPMGAGDVVELVSDGNSDNAGSLIQATAPVQVITGMPCLNAPFMAPACDHVEQSVFPAETLGKHYFVTQPTAPRSGGGQPNLFGHLVRIVGNADGTKLTYPAGKAPPGAPITLSAGQVVDMGVVTTDFEVSGDHEFAVVTFMLGGSVIDPTTEPPNQLGDPSQSNAVGVEQYRLKYVFLAPVDYTESYVDITMPMGASVQLDGASLGVTPTLISSGYGIARVKLGNGNDGAHVLTASAGVGIQVMGYGAYTSYQYPGGLNLNAIAPPPPPPK